MEYIILFNDLYNGKGAIQREAQTAATILTNDHFHLNTTLEDYGTEDMTSENDSEVERYSAARQKKALSLLFHLDMSYRNQKQLQLQFH